MTPALGRAFADESGSGVLESERDFLARPGRLFLFLSFFFGGAGRRPLGVLDEGRAFGFVV